MRRIHNQQRLTEMLTREEHTELLTRLMQSYYTLEALLTCKQKAPSVSPGFAYLVASIQERLLGLHSLLGDVARLANNEQGEFEQAMLQELSECARALIQQHRAMMTQAIDRIEGDHQATLKTESGSTNGEAQA